MTQSFSRWQKFKAGLYAFFSHDSGEDWQHQYLWDKYIPMPFAEAEKILTRDLPANTRVALDFVHGGGSGILSISGKGLFETRTFDMNKKTINPGMISTNSNKGHGYGRIIMRNEIEFFKACGAKRFNISASSTAGGYVWARFGFIPEPQAIIALLTRVQDNFKALKDVLSPQEQEDTQAAIRGRGMPDDVWGMSDLRTDIAPRLREIFDKANKGDADARALSDKLTKIEAIKNAIEEITHDQKPMPLGRALLAGSYWQGYFDLNDPAQIDRASKNIGGWKTPAQ